MSRDQCIAELAASQYCVFARFQLLALGIDDGFIRRRRRSGHWVTVAPGVYALAGHKDSYQRRLWVAYLAGGADAVVSHHAAAAGYELPGFPKAPLTITVPHPQHQRVAGATVHQSRYLPPHHWCMYWGRRTTTLPRLFVDLAPMVGKGRLDLAYEHALLNRNLTEARMSACFRELLSPGRKGMEKLATILDARGPGYVPAASELERLLFEVVAGAGLPDPVRQYPLPGRQEVKGCVDAAFVEARLILEADGRRWHTRVADFARDKARDKQAARVGWQTLRFCHVELTSDPVGEGVTIRETYDQRLWLLQGRS